MRITRLHYFQEPVFSARDGRLGDQFHHPALTAEMLKIVRKKAGLMAGEVAERMGKGEH